MTLEEKRERCTEFFNELAKSLEGSYEVLESCNADFSKYLVPKGTADQVTYHSKPDRSFRISDHWNWYANVNKCEDEHYIQCLSVDLPRARKRPAPGKPSKPVIGCQVAFMGADGKYHVVFGEKFDRKTKTWSWVNYNIKDLRKESRQ